MFCLATFVLGGIGGRRSSQLDLYFIPACSINHSVGPWRGHFLRNAIRAQIIFEFHLARQASNSQVLLVRGTSSLVQVFKGINNS